MSNAYRSVLESGGVTPTGDAVVADVLAGKTFSNANAVGLTGTMVNRGAVSGQATPSQPYTIPAGYHNGSGVVTASGAINIQQLSQPAALSGIAVTEGKHYAVFTANYSGNDQTTITGANVITTFATRNGDNSGYQSIFLIEATSTAITISGPGSLYVANVRIAQLD